MISDSQKLKVLEQYGFRYHFKRELYFSRDRRKIFSREAVEDHNSEWLKEKIEENNIHDIMIYFNGPVNVEMKNELKQVFNL